MTHLDELDADTLHEIFNAIRFEKSDGARLRAIKLLLEGAGFDMAKDANNSDEARMERLDT